MSPNNADCNEDDLDVWMWIYRRNAARSKFIALRISERLTKRERERERYLFGAFTFIQGSSSIKRQRFLTLHTHDTQPQTTFVTSAINFGILVSFSADSAPH